VTSTPRITIVTPSFNQAAFLPAAIESVLGQGYPNLEYIIVDGGSTDGSIEIIKRYADRLAWWVSERDGGQADAVAKGFARATGAVFGFLNSDDLLAPGALAEVASQFQRNPNLGIVLGAGGMVDARGRFLHGVYPMGWGVAELLSFESRFTQPAVFFSRSAYEQAGGMDAQFRFALDLDLFVRIAATDTPHVITRTPLAYTRLHPDTKTSKWQAVKEREIMVIRARHGVRPDFHQSAIRSLYWRTKHFLLRCQFEGIRNTLSTRSRAVLHESAQ
jgi:glycosyltransferase involved in cell wall biosynthesis